MDLWNEFVKVMRYNVKIFNKCVKYFFLHDSLSYELRLGKIFKICKISLSGK